MKAQRVDKLEREREALERDYRDALIAALKDCAGGRWGLFGQNEIAHANLPAQMRQRLTPAAVGILADLETQVPSLRLQLGYAAPFDLAERLAAYRKRNGSNGLGEPRLAREFLDELTALEQ